MIWASDQGDPPHYAPVANGVIEHLLEDNYFLTAHWCDSNARGRQVVINVSTRHAIFPEFPGPSLGDVVYGPGCTDLTVTRVDSQAGLSLDAADPKSLQKISRFFKASGRRGLSGSASKSPA